MKAGSNVKKYDISFVADGLTAYAIERQNDFERHLPQGRSPWAESRRFWIDAILQGMVRLEGGTPGPEMMEQFDQRLAAAHDCAAAETLTPAEQEELVRSLRNYASALEDTGEHRGLQVAVVRELLEDMATHLSWDSSANGLDHARDEVDSILLRMTARKPIHFTRILLGGDMGPADDDFVPSIVTDVDGVRGTKLFARLSQTHPEVEEWPAIATVWLCGGQTATAATVPADELELKIIREVGTRFLDYPGVRPVWPHELRVPVHEQIRVLKVEPGRLPEEITMPNTLEAFQAAVGGYIEVLDLGGDAVLVCNEEGKLAGLPANRRVCGDTIAGTFLITGSADGEFCFLSDEDAAHYAKEFEQPMPVYGDPDTPTQWEFHVF